MTIENPGVMLPLILLAMLAGLGYCVFIVWRFLRRVGKPKEEAPVKKPRRVSAFRRLTNWLGEPAAKPKAEPTAEAAGPEQAPGQPSEPGAAPPMGDVVEVMRVLRVGSMGALAVQVDGQIFRSLLEIKDGATGRRVLLAIRELEGFVGPAGKAALPELHRMSTPTAQPARSEPTVTAEQQRFLEQMQSAGKVEPEPDDRMTMGRFWRQGLMPSQRKKIEVVDTGAGFVAEIEDLIQLRMADQPGLAGRVIHFSSAPNGDLSIEVDGKFYGGLDAIPDPAVVTFIRSCIQTWENR